MAASFSPALPRPGVSVDAELYDLWQTPYPLDAFAMVTEGLRQGAALQFASSFLVALPRVVFADLARLPVLPRNATMADLRRAFFLREEVTRWFDACCVDACALVFVPVQNQYGDMPYHWIPAIACNDNDDATLVEKVLVDEGLVTLADMAFRLMTRQDRALFGLVERDEVLVGEIMGPGLDRLLDLRVVNLVWRANEPMFHARVTLSELGGCIVERRAAVASHITPIGSQTNANLLAISSVLHHNLHRHHLLRDRDA